MTSAMLLNSVPITLGLLKGIKLLSGIVSPYLIVRTLEKDWFVPRFKTADSLQNVLGDSIDLVKTQTRIERQVEDLRSDILRVRKVVRRNVRRKGEQSSYVDTGLPETLPDSLSYRWIYPNGEMAQSIRRRPGAGD